MKKVGFTIDAIILALVGYTLWHHPAVQTVTKVGFLPFVASLPSPASSVVNGSDLLISLNNKWNVTDATIAVEAQRWYNYLLHNDAGPHSSGVEELEYLTEINRWKNSLILPQIFINSVPHIIACWARNMIAGWSLYYLTGGLWALWIYGIRAKHYFPDPTTIPSLHDVLLQIRVSSAAMVFYSLAPTVGEWMIERGWTYAYHDVNRVGGWTWYFVWLVIYMTYVEWGIYWVHRLLHVPVLYNLLHKPHHIYNNRNSLSPFAGLAFDPVDGVLQASPYLVGLLLMPVHFWTHEILLFFTAIWTTNIHDTLVGDTEPIMGSAYHTIHHTTYKNNYGQIFVLFDYLHDTLAPPQHRREQWGWNTATGYSAEKAKLHKE